MFTLDISNRGINNLNGLQYASNLTYLKADGNNISNLSPLAGLNLQGCSFVSNPVTGCTLGALTGPASLLKGSAGTYTASVNGYWPAQGMIVCKLDGIQQGAPFMPSGGVASCTVNPTTAGMHTISLEYAGPSAVSTSFQVYDVATIMIIIDMLLDD